MSGTGSDPAGTLATFARFIAKRMALHFAGDRLSELELKLLPLAREAGHLELEQYLLSLMAAPLSRERLQTLARALTIGETYFLRDPRSYQVLEREVLPALLARQRLGERTLRIWSAGCSSGEEPYTLAILLSRMLPDMAQWKISLVGTDINPAVLERARQGVYSKWSFRNAPEWLMEYFTRRPDGRYQIIPRIKAMVRFDYLNLADGADAGPVDGTDRLDVIFCRNVMLYFEASQIARTMARFNRALNDGGCLFVGPTEVDQQLMTGFSCRRLEGAFVLFKETQPQKEVPDALAAPPLPRPEASLPPFGWAPGLAKPAIQEPRRAQRSTAAEPQRHPPQQPAPARDSDPDAEAREQYRAGHYQQAAACVQRALERGVPSAELLTLGARALANIARLEEARELCEAALAADRLSAPSQYLLAVILEQQGKFEAAAAAFKKVLFIDHDHLLAYFALGNLHRQAGDADEAGRYFANALKLLDRRDPYEMLAETEGLTAGGLAQLIRNMTQARRTHARG